MSSFAALDADIERLLRADDWLLRWQRRIGLAPALGETGSLRRAVFFALVAWLPIAGWALLRGHALPGGTGEPLLHHFGVNIRCLVAIPLLILAEGKALQATIDIATLFLRNRIVQPHQHPRFLALMQDTARRRDASLPWVLIGAALATGAWTYPFGIASHELTWALDGGALGFGGWWFSCVARPIYIALLAGWLWRILLAFRFFYGISRLELSLVPTHPDSLGGLGFLERYPKAYALVGFSIAAVIASGWAHGVIYHGTDVHTLVKSVAVLMVAWSVVLLLPLLAFSPLLIATKKKAKEEYGRLVGEHGRLVHERWIMRQAVSDPDLLDAPGIGPIADANAMHAAVSAMRGFPVSKSVLVPIVLPMALPMLVVFALQIPIKDLLLTLLKALA